jgi:hypothetical protein
MTLTPALSLRERERRHALPPGRIGSFSPWEKVRMRALFAWKLEATSCWFSALNMNVR